MSGFITLTTDLGWNDPYVAIVKANIWASDRQHTILDVSHGLVMHDISSAALLLKQVLPHCPAGSVHVVMVYCNYQPSPDFIWFECEGHFFIGPDNGVFTVLFPDLKDVSFHCLQKETPFPFLPQWLGNTAGKLAAGELVPSYPYGGLVEKIASLPIVGSNYMRGNVIYIDRFGNAMINITKAYFEKVRADRDFAIYFKRYDPICQLSSEYSDVQVGEVLAMFNHFGMLELSIYMGDAAAMLSLDMGYVVQIDFT